MLSIRARCRRQALIDRWPLLLRLGGVLRAGDRRNRNAKSAAEVGRRGTRHIEAWRNLQNTIEPAGVDFVHEDGFCAGDARVRPLTGYAESVAIGVDLNIANLHSAQFETDN